MAVAARPAASAKGGSVPIGGIRLSSPGRVIYPELGITKLEVAEYYEAAGEGLLPHFRDRPLTLVRCPDTYQKCFFQKHIDENKAYAWVQRVPVKEEDGDVASYLAVNSVDGVLSLVQLGALEFHTWGSRKDKLEQPDKFTLDIDPDPSVPWARVVKTAHTIRQLLSELGLQSFAKTTGGKGLHVVVPLQRRRGWGEIKAFTEAVASLLVQAAPREYTISMSKAKRGGKILVDYLRNARGSTAVEAYSTRARAGATISTPLHWDELTPDLRPDDLNVRTLPKRLASQGSDPWPGYHQLKQTITAQTLARLSL